MAVSPNLGMVLPEQAQQNPVLTFNTALLLADEKVAQIDQGPLASRPATSTDTSYYVSTDTPRTLFGPDGAGGWVSLLVEGGGSGLGAHGHTGTGDGGSLLRPKIDQSIRFVQQGSKPSAPGLGEALLYFRNDGLLYKQLPDGTENAITGGGGGGGGTAAEITFSPAGDLAATNVQAALEELDGEKAPAGHVHSAAQITNSPSGGIGSSTVQGALNELDAEKAPNAHTQAASTVTFAAAGGVAAGNVQAAIEELDADKSNVGHTHAATGITFNPVGDIVANNVQSAIAEVDSEKAPKGASYITTSAESGLTNEQVLGTAINRSGTLAARPAPGSVPTGSTYLATDDNGGTTYRSSGTAWQPMGAAVNVGSSGTGHTIQNEGVSLPQRANLNFVGTGVDAADTGGVTVVTIPGGDGGTLRTELANTSNAAQGDALLGFKQDVTGGAARTVHAKLADGWSVKDFGAMGDGTTDDLPAFNAAISAMSAPASSRGRTLFVPFGVYRLSGPLRITRNMVLQGDGGCGWNPGTSLKFDAGVHGVIVDRAGTSPDGGQGDWSVIRNLCVEAAGKTAAVHGITLHARARMENLYVKGFAGNGIHIDATVASGTNANLWSILTCRVDNCTGHGLYVNNNDANAGFALLLDCEANGGWGVYDSSFLGNGYYSCHTAGNGLGGYKTDELAAKNVFLNCYSETGQPPSQFGARTLVLHGEHGAGIAAGSMGPLLSATDLREFQVEHGLEAYNPTGSVAVRASLGKSDTTNTVFRAWSGDVNNDYRLRYGASNAGWWDWIYGNLGNKIVLSMSTEAAAEGSGLLRLPNGYILGAGAVKGSRSMGTAIPSNAVGAAGDLVYNYNPQPGGPYAWVKTGEAPNRWAPVGIVDLFTAANTWAGTQRFNAALTLAHVTQPAAPAAGLSVIYARTSDGHPIVRLPGGAEIDLAEAGGAGADHNHTATGDGGKLTGAVFDGVTTWERVSPPSWTGLTQAKVYSPNTGLALFVDIAGRLRVGNDELINDPILDLGSNSPGQANSINLRNGSGTASMAVVGTPDQFVPGSHAGDTVFRSSTGSFHWGKDGSTPCWFEVDNGVVRVLDRLEVGGTGALINHIYSATQVWDAPALPPGGWADVDVSVAGANIGDVAHCALNVSLPSGVGFLQPQVVATNTVRCTLQNWTTATVDPGSGTLRVQVTKFA